MKTALAIPVDGPPYEIDIPPPGGSELASLQELVGGWIEYVPTAQDVTLYCNEEGKILGLPYNQAATRVFGSLLREGDYLAGNVVVLGLMDEEGENTSIDSVWLEVVKAS